MQLANALYFIFSKLRFFFVFIINNNLLIYECLIIKLLLFFIQGLNNLTKFILFWSNYIYQRNFSLIFWITNRLLLIVYKGLF